MKELKKYIPIVGTASNIKRITKGFSFDQKYVIDDTYLLRVFSSENDSRRRMEFETIQQLQPYSSFVPEAIEYGTIPVNNQSYMVLTYFPGKDAEVALKELTESEQYNAGFSAGRELFNLHKLKAPKGLPTWYVHKKQKTEKYLKQFESIQVDKSLKKMMVCYIEENMAVMQGQPNTFQHDDFHPSNLLIHNQKFAGIIDFQRMDWGDPIHDLHKLGFFSSRISVPFTRGIVDGYHDEQEIGNFWELYALYSAIHIVSALVWGKKMGNFETMLEYSMDVIQDHDNFYKMVPNWYS